MLNARVVAGFRLLDRGLIDDKIIAVLEDDPLWGQAEDLSEIPPPLVARLRHDFQTCKVLDPSGTLLIEFRYHYGTEEAAIQDYEDIYGHGPREGSCCERGNDR